MANAMNPVSLLNETCQRVAAPPPVYAPARTGGEDHTPIFTCEVTALNKKVKSGPKRSKKDAKEDAARKWLQLSEDDTPPPRAEASHGTVHLDVENCPGELERLLDMKRRGQIKTLRVYAAAAWPGLKQVREKCAGLAALHTVDSGNKNVADVYIIMGVTHYLAKHPPPYEEHTIVSKDKLFYAFIDVINGAFPNNNVLLTQTL